MPTASKRNRQVADLIRREVALLIKTAVSDPRLAQVTVTSVDLSPDLNNACIYYVLPDEIKNDEVVRAFKKAIGFIRHELSVRTTLRYTPQIRFCYDDSITRAQRIMSLIKDIETDTND